MTILDGESSINIYLLYNLMRYVPISYEKGLMWSHVELPHWVILYPRVFFTESPLDLSLGYTLWGLLSVVQWDVLAATAFHFDLLPTKRRLTLVLFIIVTPVI